MKNLSFLLPLLFLLACQSDPAEKTNNSDTAVKQYTIEQFMDNTTIYGGSFSHDESKILVGSNKTGIINAYTIPITGGEPTALTTSEETVRPVSLYPSDDRLLYLSDDGGNEQYHLFVRETDGSIKELTVAENSRAVFYGWANDKKSFYVGWNKRDPKLMDVYEFNRDDYSSKMIYKNDDSYDFGGISNDKTKMALSKSITTNDSDLFVYDFKTKQNKKINEVRGSFQAADFSTDSRHLYYLSNADGEFNALRRYDIQTEEHEEVLKTDWDVAYTYFSKTGKYRVTGTNEDGKTVVQIQDMTSNQPVKFPDFGDADITSVNISDSEKLLSFYVGGSNTTSNLYIYNFATGDYKQLTKTMNPEIAPKDLVQAEVVRFPSFDQESIPAIYYKPLTASAENKVPALVWVHGGPGGQSRMNYSPLIQYIVNHGYAVLMVNNRGSSGYGKSFFKMDDKNHGEGDLKDCIYGKNYLAELDYIDKEKIGIIGGSYGGYMVMRAMTHTPDEFAVGVNIFGVTNWLRTLKSIPPWWESFKTALYEEMGDPMVDSVRLHNISPLFHADKVTNPIMVLQGAQDPRVLQVESDEIVEAVKKNNVPVEYVLFEDEGHGFVKKENQIEAYSKILDFLEKYLRKEERMKG